MFLSTKISFKNSKFTLVEFPLTSLPTARVTDKDDNAKI